MKEREPFPFWLILFLFIITWIMIALFSICGCEKEQPLSEWHWDVIIEEKRADGFYISEIKMIRKIDPIIDQRITEPNEPKTYTAEELNEIYKDEPALGKLVKRLWGVGDEPNEPTMHEREFVPFPEQNEPFIFS